MWSYMDLWCRHLLKMLSSQSAKRIFPGGNPGVPIPKSWFCHGLVATSLETQTPHFWWTTYSMRSIGPSLNFLIHLVLELNSIYPKLIIANYGVRFIIPFHESKQQNTIISNFNLSNRGSAPGVAGFQSIRSLAGGASEGTSQFCSVEPLWWVMKNGGFP
jgi:hypothetical protein